MYAYIYKIVMKHYKNDLELKWIYQGFENVFFANVLGLFIVAAVLNLTIYIVQIKSFICDAV